MREFFDPKNRYTDGADPALLRERRFYTILTGTLFILGAFSFWEFVYELCNMIGSISCGDPGQALNELIRMLPLILTAWIYAYLQIYAHRAYTAPTAGRRIETWRVNGLLTIVLGLMVVICVVAGLITGTYEHAVEGYISPLFPLDIMIGGLLFIGYGVQAVRYSIVLSSTGSRLPYVPAEHCVILRIIGRFFCGLSYLVAISSFAACFYGTYVMDWTHGWIFYNIMLWLNFAAAVAQAVFYRTVFTELKQEAKRLCMLKAGAVILVINIILLALYLVSVEMFNEAPDQNAFGILPIEFTASFNAFLPIYALNNIAAPLAAFIKGLAGLKGKRK